MLMSVQARLLQKSRRSGESEVSPDTSARTVSSDDAPLIRPDLGNLAHFRTFPGVYGPVTDRAERV